MLVRVKVKATGNEQVITNKAYQIAKKLYVYIGPAEKDSDLHNPDDVSSFEVEPPNLTATANLVQVQIKEEEKGAEVVADDAPKKRGPKPKNQISSPAPAVEV